ncbi:hypothetical protein [Azospirillum doebereinerae]
MLVEPRRVIPGARPIPWMPPDGAIPIVGAHRPPPVRLDERLQTPD